MKKWMVLSACLYIAGSGVFAQTGQGEYNEYEDCRPDSTGNWGSVKNSEFYRISALDHSSWGFKNRQGAIVIPLGKYTFLNPVDEQGMILAHKDGKGGYIDITEKVLIPFLYDKIGVFSECTDLAPAIKDGKQGFLDRKGDVVIPFDYDAISYVTYFYAPGVAILVKNGCYGVIDSRNRAVIPFEYDKINHSDSEDCFIVKQGKKYAFFSLDGRRLSDFMEYEIESAPLGSLPAGSKNLPVLITQKNKQKAGRQDATGSGNGSSADSQQEFAYLDKKGRMIVPFGMYDYAEPFGLGRKAIVAKKGAYGLIDESGKLVLPLVYDRIERPSHYSTYADIFVAVRNDSVTFLDKDAGSIPIGEIVSCTDDGNGALLVTNAQGKRGCIDYKGNLAVPFRYKNIYKLRDDLVFVNESGRAGIIDPAGRTKIPFEYDAIYDTWYDDPELEGRYIVIKNGKVGTVDAQNRVIIPLLYDGLSGWVEYGPEEHFVKKDGKYGLLSPEGKIVIPIEYEYIDLPRGEIIIVRKNGKYGAVNRQNKTILPCVYDRLINDFPWSYPDDEKPRLVALKDSVWSYLDPAGKLVRKDVPKDEIREIYGYRLDWGEPSGEWFDMKQPSGCTDAD